MFWNDKIISVTAISGLQISHQNRRYAEGWTTEPGRDSQLEYRLSIYHAREDDSGRYTCVTPMGHKHTVEIVVKCKLV